MELLATGDQTGSLALHFQKRKSERFKTCCEVLNALLCLANF